VRELPGEVYVTGQLDEAQIQALSEQGIKSFVNNRPDMEGHEQPRADALAQIAQDAGAAYFFIPMAGGLTPGIIEASVTAYTNAPRPIVTFCASGMRSAALWAFAHVKELGVEPVMEALSGAGYNLEQIRSPLTQYAKAD